MPCCNNNARCPRCGRPRRCRNAQSGTLRASSGTAGSDTATNTGCCSTPTPAQELYGADRSALVCRDCYDPVCGASRYPQSWRNDFWPNFAHPRWLPCDALYNCRCRR